MGLWPNLVVMAKKFPLHPAHPERLCWGCDQYCAANDMRCGNGSDRTQHPVELFGDDWSGWDGDELAVQPTSQDASSNPGGDPVRKTAAAG